MWVHGCPNVSLRPQAVRSDRRQRKLHGHCLDWSETKAFLGVHSDLWLNLVGREPQGCVTQAEAGPLLDEIAAGLLEISDPETGERVVAAVHRKEEIYSGGALDMAPDLICDTWSAGYRMAPGRSPSGPVVIPPAPLAGVDVAWSSDHRPVGIFVGAGPGFRHGIGDELNLHDVCPTTLALLGEAVPEGLDGKPATPSFDEGFLKASPVTVSAALDERETGGEYSEEEAAAVAEHLKDLGYIE
jgi:predicted AlkP superfamily phosphohydrolase/phosphomutase